MTQTEDLKTVALSSLEKDALNVVEIEGLLKAVVFYDGKDVKVIQDVCPHMGAPLSTGKFCAHSQTLVCPWHGYEYSTKELVLTRNPNEETWTKPMVGKNASEFDTPSYKLKQMDFRIENGSLIISRPAAVRPQEQLPEGEASP